MTIYIAHRQNSKKSLLKKNEYFSDGLEIDLRSNSNKIIMSHDPFKKGLDFVKNIKFLKNNFLLIDIKSTGIYKKVIQILKKKKIKFLFLNLISSEFVEMINRGLSRNLLLRFSSYENINLKNKKLKKITWIWVDFFQDEYIKKNEYNYIKKFNKKICLASPDLLRKSSMSILKLIKYLNRNQIKIDMVCTKKKNIKLWKKFYKY